MLQQKPDLGQKWARWSEWARGGDFWHFLFPPRSSLLPGQLFPHNLPGQCEVVALGLTSLHKIFALAAAFWLVTPALASSSLSPSARLPPLSGFMVPRRFGPRLKLLNDIAKQLLLLFCEVRQIRAPATRISKAVVLMLDMVHGLSLIHI